MITVSMNTTDFAKQIKAYEVLKQQRFKDHVAGTALDVERDAKRNAPVDTGRLRSSIQLRDESISGLTVFVGTDVDYAEAMEFGPNGQPYLNPAAESNRPAYIKGSIEILK